MMNMTEDTQIKRFQQNIRLGCKSFLPALEDPETIEIMLNADGSLWQERLYEPMKIIAEINQDTARSILNTVSAYLGKELTHDSPLLEGEFPLGNYRFAAQIPPVVAAPVFSLRKPAGEIFTLDQYVSNGILSSAHRDIITKAIIQHDNILIIGGTSSGKTTLLNAIIRHMAEQFPNERFLIAEDTGEIQCAAVNRIHYHTTPEVDFTAILKSFLRMRPDRIIFGEVRDHAALDLLDAWNSGHRGGVSTLHANNTLSGLSKLRSLVSRHPFAPRAIEEVIGDVVDLVIHIQKTPQGRRVKDILRLTGFDTQKESYNYAQTV
jgi:type IV secretion system protein VirB11